MNKTHQVMTQTPIRDEVGRLHLRMCQAKLHYSKPVSQHIVTTNRKTVGDILNKLQFNNHLRSIVDGK